MGCLVLNAEVKRNEKRTWNWKVSDLVSKYSLREDFREMENKKQKWKTIVTEAVEKKAIEDWRDGVRRGKKLGSYCSKTVVALL